MEKETQSLNEQYNSLGAWGLYTSVDVHNCDPIIIRSAEMIKQFVIQLCDLIEMKRYKDCIIENFGEDERVAGYSAVQLIETSCITMHLSNASNTTYLDLFSCKYYDPNVVAEFALNYFKGSDYDTNIKFRK